MMNTIRKNLVVLFIALPAYVIPASAADAKDERAKPASVTRYSAAKQQGLIGVTPESPVDNPADNIFHVPIQDVLCGDETVWLEYELEGVESHVSVSRSINDQVATGGYFVKQRAGWRMQRERVDVTWLKTGDNVIRFTLPAGATHNYRVRNLSLEVERAGETGNVSRALRVDQSSAFRFGQHVYLKGFATGEGASQATVSVDGQAARMFRSEFESIIPVSHPLATGETSTVVLEIIYPDGFSLCQEVAVTSGNADLQYARQGSLIHAEKIVAARQAASITLGGAKLVTPEGALENASFLSITALRDIDIPALDAGMVNVTRVHEGFRFLPHGMTFTRDVSLHLPYDPEKIPAGYTEQDIRTYYFDEQSHHWVPVPLDSLMGENAELWSRTNHFTDFINAIIKVPESPEVNAYNSTSMKGIKAANPTAAVNLINPPQANNTGSAGLSYPIHVPAGRNGMQPQLSITYNSGGGNGWLGLGWNLTTPAIGIDTRWGVPRYDPEKETETYTMQGEQLSPVAHRAEPINRVTGKREFHPRVEGGFSKITRYGSSPADYWWEVIDKNGTRYLYGGSSGSFDPGTVLRTDEENEAGSIAQWCLSEVRDLNGNVVKYHYHKEAHVGLAKGTVKGYQIYIKKITYSDDRYSVEFFRERELDASKTRPDIMISGNLGFKQVTADLLKTIEVKYAGNPVRKYVLDYREGAFFKTLLQSINEYDAAGKFFNKHTFDYFDDVEAKNGYKPFATATSWTPGADDVGGDFLNPIKNFGDEVSALSGTKSKDRTFGGAATVGFNAKVNSKSFSVGGSFSSTTSRSEGLLSLIDLNGDGLPDKVFIENGDFKYRPNLSVASGEPRFGPEVSIKGPVNNFHKEKSKTRSTGFEAHGPGPVPAFGGYSEAKTTSETSVYFTEANGDQLPDIVKDGVVYFNHIDPDTGHPSFTASSEDTPSPINTSGTISDDLFDEIEDGLQEAIKENPLHDVVRMWQAPYSGRVRVTAPVQLIRIDDEDRAETPADGVRVAIQLRDTELWTTTIGPEDYGTHTPSGVSDLTVQKGDRLYFRVGSVFNGSYDRVSWSPVVAYLDLDPALHTDANNRSNVRYDSKEGFKLSALQEISTPINGAVAIKSVFKKPVTSDDVWLELIREVKDPNDPDKVLRTDVVMFRQFKAAEAIQHDTLINVDVENNHSFHFRVNSNSNVDWAAVDWRPRVYYTASYDPDYPTITDANGNPLLEFYPVPKYTLYPVALQASRPYKVWSEKDTLTIKVRPSISIKEPDLFERPVSGDIYFTVKKNGTLLYKDTLVVRNNEVISPSSTASLEVLKNDRLFFEYHVPTLPGREIGEQLAYAIIRRNVSLTVNDTLKTHAAGLYTEIDERMIFGPMYRHWGHFAYHANGERATRAIDQGDLKVNENLKDTPKTDPDDLENGKDLNGENTYEPSGEKFIILVPVGKESSWNGYDPHTWLSASAISSSRMGEDDLTATTPIPGTGAKAVKKITKSTSVSYSLGASAGIAGASKTWSDGESRVVTDFMDMNGDRYPDIVVGKRIQFTHAQGGLSDLKYEHGDLHNMYSTNDATGASLSGSFTTSKSSGGISANIKKAVVSIGDGKSSAGLSLNVGNGNNDTQFTWSDINGDGLPDRVSKNGVRLNLGYSFAAEESWEQGPVQKGKSSNEGGGLGISLWNGSISAGVSLARSDNDVTHTLQDVNGDGLVDLLRFIPATANNPVSQPLRVRLNTGNGFAPEMEWKGAYRIGESSSASESVNGAFTVGIYLPAPINIKIVVNPSKAEGRGVTRELAKLTDIDGDGFPDYLTSKDNDNLTVSRSTIGRTNLLKEVKRPLGASFALDYKRIGNTYAMPNDVWALSGVVVADGFKGDGADTLRTSFAYEDGKYDRHEREFYGFSKVVTRSHDTQKDNAVYTIVTQTFKNDNYYEKGLLVSEVMTDGNGSKWVEKENVYALKNVKDGSTLPVPTLENDPGMAFPALVETRQRFYEGQAEAGKSTRTIYGYDERGNVTSYTDFGDEGDEDNLSAAIVYYNVEATHITGSPKSIKVTGSGRTYRHRESVIDESTGNVTQIKQFLDADKVAVHDLEYDGYGNLTKITRPANSQGERLSISYEYDNAVHTYPTRVSNSYGYSSEATYDFRFGQALTSKDLNGNVISYELDALGRVFKITGPYEKANGSDYTIRFEYHPEADVPWALTQHFDPANPGNALETAIFVDGLGRVLQTKKDVALYTGDGKPDKEAMVVSGRVIFDAFGRTVSARYPVTETKGGIEETKKFNFTEDEIAPTLSEYDVLNRTLTVTLPDKSVTKTAYGFSSDNRGKMQFSTKTTDANGKQTEQFTDVRGRVTAVKNYTTEKDIWTSFAYNAINEQIEAMDDLGYTTFSTYDNFGRRISRNHPDAGITNYSYDLAGNLTQLETANLRKEGGVIEYKYDRERLTEILYPQNPENNVKYTYGEAGASDNRAGRIVVQEDASGAQEFFYGPLGEVVKNIRTVVIPQHDEQTYTTQWTYDTWNRLTSMTYADGEKVTYIYNVGGLLHSMSGKKKGDHYNYVKQLGYDKFEQRVFLAYGNGTKTTYDYEPDRRRLKNMTAQTSAKRLFMDNTYTYDKVNNILSLKNNAAVPASNLMGGSSEYSYNYDDLYRLTEATGSFKGSNEEHRYNLKMMYNSVGGITQKVQRHERSGGDGGSFKEQKKTTYDQSYTYSEEQPHAPIHIGRQAFTYDANGNQTGWTDDVSGQRRRILWDEENRIRAIYDNGAMYHYIYDASGERVLKGQSAGQRVYVNGEWKTGSGNMGNYTVYVNPYIVLKSGGYTKHYYIEGQRIVSKLGGGWDNNGKGPLKAGGDKIDYNGKRQKVFDGLVKNIKFLGSDGQVLTAGKSGKVPPGQLNGSGGGTSTSEIFRYFYHPDHLGSTSYVTDASGEVYQHLEYFAFGETFVEEHSNTNRTPYLFNGKELDEETGLYYYGARYYDARTSVWASVDPMAEKYPWLSPYNYTSNNPVNFVDPNGMEIEFAKGTSSKDKREFMKHQRHLNRGSRTARNQWKELKRSKNVHTIHLNEKDDKGQLKNSGVQAKGEIDRQKGNGTDIYINLNEKPEDGAPFMVIIGHEEAHAIANDRGEVEDVRPKTELTMSAEDIINAVFERNFEFSKNVETAASHVENVIRAELDPTGLKIKLRATYTIYKESFRSGKYYLIPVQINVIKDGYRYYKK